jgi:allophanate hydrolase
MKPIDMTIAGLRAAYAAGTTPDAVIDAVFRRLAEIDDPGIFIAMLSREAVAAYVARLGPAGFEAKPLWGVPFAIKDNIDLAGLPTTAACPAFAYAPAESAHAVRRLIDAGAIPIGKTNLDQFATGLVGVRTPWSIPRNAADPALVPGGSSSGSAVAVAHGIVAFALGTDTAGSGRVPAALNGIVGLKPTLGAVSTRGVVPACRTLDCVSVFATSVSDAWTVYEAMAGFDAADPYSRRITVGQPGALPPVLRVGVPMPGQREFFGDTAAAAVYAAHLEALSTHATLVEIDLEPFLRAARLLYEGPWVAERFVGLRGFMAEHADDMHPVTRAITRGGEAPSAADAFAAMYELAALRRATERTWAAVDALCVPSIPAVYTVEEVLADPVVLNSRLGIYTNFVNLLDLCALAVPGTPRSDGRPAGVTLIAPAGRDGLIAGLGAAFTGAVLPTAAPADMIPLVVVGAHMSGLPLNSELTDAGGVFLRATETAPLYRLHALPDCAPPRPGLLRVGEATGRAVPVEVWALPAESFGRLVARIPAPLSIGTIQLADGSCAKGFLAESAGLAGAQDITALGGWRAFVAAETAA